MATLKIPIPDFVDQSKNDIYVFWGREVIARKLRGKQLEVKVTRCNFCGLCCSNLDPNVHFFGVKEDGTCEYLKYEILHFSNGETLKGWFCKHPRGDAVPFSCCSGRGTPKECVIKFKKVK